MLQDRVQVTSLCKYGQKGQCSRYSDLLQPGWYVDQILVGGVRFVVPVQTVPQGPTSLPQNGYWGSFSGVKQPRSDEDHSIDVANEMQ
jgi:hypothetical protein